MKKIDLTAKDLGLIISALEIVNPDTTKDLNRARNLAFLIGTLEANQRYTISLKGGK